MNISIFKRRTISGRIRGEQIAQYAGFQLNPDTNNLDWKNDACVYVKQIPRGGKRQYMDIVDHMPYVRVLQNHPEFKAIAISKTAYEYLTHKLKNEVFLVRQQHCNPNRIQRIRKEVINVGFCGGGARFCEFESEVKEKFKKIGMNFTAYYHFHTQQDVINFYQNLDVQIVWRKPSEIEVLKNPLKLSNAGSFGIPTVARAEDNFVAEYDGYFIPATSIDDMVDKVRQLRDDEKLYKEWSDKVKIRAEDYHISNIVKEYLKLGEE